MVLTETRNRPEKFIHRPNVVRTLTQKISHVQERKERNQLVRMLIPSTAPTTLISPLEKDNFASLSSLGIKQKDRGH